MSGFAFGLIKFNFLFVVIKFLSNLLNETSFLLMLMLLSYLVKLIANFLKVFIFLQNIFFIKVEIEIQKKKKKHLFISNLLVLIILINLPRLFSKK